MRHPFDEAIELNVVDGGLQRGRTHPEWANMVGPFGGITAAVLLHAIEQHPDRFGEPLALTVNFAAPIADGEFDVTLQLARSNRTNQHWIVQLVQDGIAKTTATAVFATRRDTWGDIQSRMPHTPVPEEAIEGGLPDFIRWAGLYDMRFVEGVVPGKGVEPGDSSTTTLWVRDRAQRRVDFPALAALCDIFTPRVFLRRGALPAGTISMTAYFHVGQAQLDTVGDDFVLGSAHANVFNRGYFDQSARLWGTDGTLLATTHQIVYFKDGK